MGSTHTWRSREGREKSSRLSSLNYKCWTLRQWEMNLKCIEQHNVIVRVCFLVLICLILSYNHGCSLNRLNHIVSLLCHLWLFVWSDAGVMFLTHLYRFDWNAIRKQYWSLSFATFFIIVKTEELNPSCERQTEDNKLKIIVLYSIPSTNWSTVFHLGGQSTKCLLTRSQSNNYTEWQGTWQYSKEVLLQRMPLVCGRRNALDKWRKSHFLICSFNHETNSW